MVSVKTSCIFVTFVVEKIGLWLLVSQLLKLGVSAMLTGLVDQPLGVFEMLLKPRLHLIFGHLSAQCAIRNDLAM